MHTNKTKKEPISAPVKLARSVGTGVAAGIITLCVSMCLASVSIQRSSLDGSKVFVFAVICADVSSLVTGFIAAEIMRCKGILHGTMSSFLLACILILFSFLCSDFKFTYHSVVILLTMILTGAAGGIAAVNFVRR